MIGGGNFQKPTARVLLFMSVLSLTEIRLRCDLFDVSLIWFPSIM